MAVPKPLVSAWRLLNHIGNALSVWQVISIFGGATVLSVVMSFVAGMPLGYAVMLWFGVALVTVGVTGGVLSPAIERRQTAKNAPPTVTIPEEEYERLQNLAMSAPPPPEPPQVKQLPSGRLTLSCRMRPGLWETGQVVCIAYVEGGNIDVGQNWIRTWPIPAPGTLMHATWPDDFMAVPDEGSVPSPGIYLVTWAVCDGAWVSKDLGRTIYRSRQHFADLKITYDPPTS